MEATIVPTSAVPPTSDSYRDLRFPTLFEAAAIGIALCHFDGRILEGNSTLARLLGYEQRELAGLDPWKFHDGNSSAASRLADLLRGVRDSFAVEKNCRRKDASEFNGRLTVSLARNTQHDPAFLIVLLEDITERAQLEQQLRQAEKMEIIGRLTGGIAHDFNNLLTGFLLYCDLLLSKLDPADPLCRHVEDIRQAGEQGSALTKQLLAFARKQAPQPRPTALNLVVSSTETLLRRLIGEHIELVVALDPNAGEVFADSGQLRQVLLNLALNARDALTTGGKITVRTGQTRFSENPRVCQACGRIMKCRIQRGNDLESRADSADSDNAPDTAELRSACARPAVSLIVEDNGCGMTSETRAHLFEPLFTTKLTGKGTGMGLATVHRIVTELEGQIDVTSEPTRGTRVEVFLPAHRASAHQAPAHQAPADHFLAHQAGFKFQQMRDELSETGPQLLAQQTQTHANRSSGGPVQVGRSILQSIDDPTTRLPDVSIPASPDGQIHRPSSFDNNQSLEQTISNGD